MARKGITNNPKGRPKGIPNKTTTDLRRWVKSLLDDNREVFEADLKKLDSAQRLSIMEKLMQYCIPKQTQVDVKAQVAAEYAELERLLQSAPDAAVQAIADRVAEIQKLSNNETNQR